MIFLFHLRFGFQARISCFQNPFCQVFRGDTEMFFCPGFPFRAFGFYRQDFFHGFSSFRFQKVGHADPVVRVAFFQSLFCSFFFYAVKTVKTVGTMEIVFFFIGFACKSQIFQDFSPRLFFSECQYFLYAFLGEAGDECSFVDIKVTDAFFQKDFHCIFGDFVFVMNGTDLVFFCHLSEHGVLLSFLFTLYHLFPFFILFYEWFSFVQACDFYYNNISYQ